VEDTNAHLDSLRGELVFFVGLTCNSRGFDCLFVVVRAVVEAAACLLEPSDIVSHFELELEQGSTMRRTRRSSARFLVETSLFMFKKLYIRAMAVHGTSLFGLISFS
jgi:hypothetical protein